MGRHRINESCEPSLWPRLLGANLQHFVIGFTAHWHATGAEVLQEVERWPSGVVQSHHFTINDRPVREGA
jgi:hypothetical protein